LASFVYNVPKRLKETQLAGVPDNSKVVVPLILTTIVSRAVVE
jgi:hypothetical protein